MLNLSFKVFRSFFRERTGSFLLITSGIYVILTGFIFIFSRGIMVYEEEAYYNRQTSTVTIHIGGEGVIDTDEFIYDFLSSDEMPDILQVMAADYEHEVIGHGGSTELGIHIPYGSYFTQDEVEAAAEVVLLSEAYLNQVDTDFIPDMLNSAIRIADSAKEYRVTGRYNSVVMMDPMNSQEVIIPFRAFLQDGFLMNELRLVFYESPSDQVLYDIEHFFTSNYEIAAIDFPDKSETEAVSSLLYEIMSHLIIFGICLITLFHLLKYWIRANYRKFYIYYLCGASAREVLYLLVLNTCYMYGISAVLSCLTYKLTEGYFVTWQFAASLGIAHYTAIYLVAFTGAMLTTVIVAARQLRNFTRIKEVLV